MIKIVTRRPWLDKQVNKIREIGEVQEVTEERYEEIVETLKTFKDATWVEIVEGVEKEVPEYDDITTEEIKERLEDLGIEYNPKANKQELYNLLVG